MNTDLPSNREVGLIKLAARRGLITNELARDLIDGLGNRAATVVLVENGVDTHVVRRLRAEQARTCIPKQIHGYRLTSHLGNGGMSVVFRGEAEGRLPVAIKLLSPRLDHDPRAAARFLREIRSASEVVDEHVIRCAGHGECNGRPYQVLELMPGGDCQAKAACCAPTPPGTSGDSRGLGRPSQTTRSMRPSVCKAARRRLLRIPAATAQ